MNVYSLLLLLFYPISSFGFVTITTTTTATATATATMHHNNQDATASDDDDDDDDDDNDNDNDAVTVPLIHIDTTTTTTKIIIDDDVDNGTSSSTTTVITNLPSRKTSRLLVSALKDSGFALVQSNLLTSDLQLKTLQAASQFLARNNNDDNNNNNNSAQEDKAVVVDVISHPTDPKVYAMLDSVDQYDYVDSSNDDNNSIIKEYVDVLRLIKTDILRHIAVGLLSSFEDDNDDEIDVDFFAKLHDEHNDTLRLITYYPTHSITTGNRCKEHSDYGTITLLSTDGISGLELYHNGRWKPVPFVEGTLVINVGSLLSGWTKGILRATLHRVAGPGSINSGSNKEDLFEATKHPRTSIAFFADPNYNVSESLTATAAATAVTSPNNNNNNNDVNDDKEEDPLTIALEGMSVSEYIRWRSGGTDDDIKRSGVSFTKNETDVLLLNK
jgi:hypothetical protein